MNYKNLEKDIKKIKKEFQISLKSFKNDSIFSKKEIVYTKAEKIRLKKKWVSIKNTFLGLRAIIKDSKYNSLGDYNSFVIRYYVTNLYYENLLKINKLFGIHEDFIRQQLDERFKYNYNSIARYIYRFKFLYFLNYHKKFVLLLENKIDKDLIWIMEEIRNQKELKIKKRLFFDSINILYHMKYFVLKIVYHIVKYVGTLFSNIKLKFRKGGLITKENRNKYLKIAEPGDIILTRTNRVATNISIPGFWKHMSMYIGTGEYLEENFSKYIEGLNKDKHYIIESVGGGVQVVEFKELCKHNDYLCVLRPNFSDDKKYRAIKQTLKSIGKKYDFLFNYHSDKSFVCSELITKSYLKDDEADEGLTISLEKIGLGIAYPPNNLIKKLSKQQKNNKKELSEVIFIDSIEKTKHNFINRDKQELYDSYKRSRYTWMLK